MARILLVAAMIAALGAGCDDGGNPSGPDGCDGLGALACRANPLCEPDFCYACSCAPTFEGCRAIADAPFDCPQLGCPQPMCCGEQADCVPGNTLRCFEPGTRPMCGACTREPGNCTADSACDPAGTANICDPIVCTCENERQCVPGCAATGAAPCGDGLVCDTASSRCVAQTCGAGAPCPENFDCAAGTCTQRACTSDDQCDGFCVYGACFSAQGTCQPPAA